MTDHPLRFGDDLGLRHAFSDRILALLVGAMVCLAALAGAGCIAGGGLAGHWRGASDGVTIQVPTPDAAAAAALLGQAAHRLTQAELADTLQPWLGPDAGRLALTLPAVFTRPGSLPPALEQALARAAPGTLVSRDTVWQQLLANLANSLQACAALALGVVALVAAGVVVVATHTGLAARRDAIEIVHQLGATDGRIAGSFARRIAVLAFIGASAGALLATPALLALASVAAPFQMPAVANVAAGPQVDGAMRGFPTNLPPSQWMLLAALPFAATLIAWLTAQATVRSWLGRLP